VLLEVSQICTTSQCVENVTLMTVLDFMRAIAYGACCRIPGEARILVIEKRRQFLSNLNDLCIKWLSTV